MGVETVILYQKFVLAGFDLVGATDSTTPTVVNVDLGLALYSSDKVNCPMTQYGLTDVRDPTNTAVTQPGWMTLNQQTGILTLQNYQTITPLLTWSLKVGATTSYNFYSAYGT
jgi:D-serine deaminase-like pyridoxal phosphate-dependent protein